MAIKYEKKKQRQNYVLYTIITAFSLCVLFVYMINYFYQRTQEDAYENLHIQTKQIKDDLTLQLLSDKENLTTMANFASKLYKDGEKYDIMFESFKPIGLIENIGILNPDNTFVTKSGTLNLNGLISFEEEMKKGDYISGRVKDVTRDNYEIIRSAVPIKAYNKTIGILYGVIKLDRIGEKYNEMTKDIDAQLFVYDKANGDLIIDTVHDTLGNISFLKDRKYNDGYTYEQMATTDKGFTSFMSAYKNENMHMHYSVIEDLGWGIALARYDSQVFAATGVLIINVFVVFSIMMLIIILYIIILMKGEKKRNFINTYSSEIRKVLLETSGSQNSFDNALKMICIFTGARSSMFFDTNGEDYSYIRPENKDDVLSEKEKKHFRAELFRYAAELYRVNEATVNVMCIKPNKHLKETNPSFYEFMNKYKFTEISFAAVTNHDNHTAILGEINSKDSKSAGILTEKVAVCFSIALNNKNYLDRTLHSATTDALTGAMNRVAYKRDIVNFDKEKALDFSCIYIDVNELHMRNNKYGHAAGDEMLIYIANTLKEVFFGHKVYRMGGDEFLVFTENISPDAVKKNIDFFVEQLKIKEYNVAIGMSYRPQNTNTEEMVREAEIRMYDEKALFYQNKAKTKANKNKEEKYALVKTGIREIDALLTTLKDHYTGIYHVSLETDRVDRIMMPVGLGYNESEEHYSKLFSRFVAENVEADFQRPMTSFINYDSIKKQLHEGMTPTISFRKTNNENIQLSVYKIGENVNDTLWIFSKK